MHSYYHGALKYNFQRFIVEEGKAPRVAYQLAKPLAKAYAKRQLAKEMKRDARLAQ